MLYFFLAACVLVLLVTKFLPDNSPRQRTERLLTMMPDFAPALRHDDLWNARMLVLDPASSRFAIGEIGGPVRAFDFAQLIAVEIEKDGITIEKTNRGSQLVGAAIGGALLGPAGMLLGGLTGSKRQKDTTTRLALKLIVNDLENPVIEIIFLDSAANMKRKAIPSKAPAPKSSPQERLAEWHGRFRAILHGQQRIEPTPASAPTATFGRRRGLLAEG